MLRFDEHILYYPAIPFLVCGQTVFYSGGAGTLIVVEKIGALSTEAKQGTVSFEKSLPRSAQSPVENIFGKQHMTDLRGHILLYIAYCINYRRTIDGG